MTHSELCMIGAEYVKNRSLSINRKEWRYIAVERKSMSSEIPDIWATNGSETLNIEVKASRSDFLRDKKKKSRRSDSCSCGDFKYYLAPEGLITVDEIPDTWGLIVADQDGNIKILRQAVYSQGAKFNDIAMMYSILRAYETKKTIYIRNEK